jgi:hypothetical protein
MCPGKRSMNCDQPAVREPDMSRLARNNDDVLTNSYLF